MNLPTARHNVATRLQETAASGAPDAARILATAAAIDAGEDDGGWAVKHELVRLGASEGVK